MPYSILKGTGILGVITAIFAHAVKEVHIVLLLIALFIIIFSFSGSIRGSTH